MKRMTIIQITLSGVAICSLILYCKINLPIHETQFDDAYMFLRYAKHWLSGTGFSWNPTEGPAYGITSVSHLLAVTAVRALTNLPDPLVLITISFFAGLASIVVLTMMGFVFFKQLRRYWAPLLIIPYMVLGPLFSYHSKTGMETTLSLLFNSVFAFAVLYFTERRSKTSLVLCLVTAYISFLTRPDIGLYCLLLPPLFIIAADLRHWRQGLLYVGSFAMLLCVDLLLKKVMFGDFLPLPFFSKSAGFYRGYLGSYKFNAAHETITFLRESLPYLFVMVTLVSRSTLSRLAAILLPIVLTFGYYATVMQIMGFFARYYYPSLPFFILGAFIATNSYLEDRFITPSSQSNLRFSKAFIAVLVLFVLTSPLVEAVSTEVWQKWLIAEPIRFKALKHYTTHATERLPIIGGWRAITEVDSLLRRLPPKISIASSEYGYIGSQHPDVAIIDLVGLNDRHIAHQGFSANYLFSRKPDIIWFPHPDYSYETKEILESKAFVENYDFYPDAYDYGLAVLKCSNGIAQINEVLEDEFSRIYPGCVIFDYRAKYY